MKSRLFFLAFVCVTFFVQGQDSTTQKLPIAILTLDAKGISDQEAEILTERLRSAFVQDGGYQVVERSQMESILAEQGFQQTGCTTNECLVQAGLILGVQEMVGGSIGKIGFRYAVDVRLFDVESSEIIKAVSRNVSGSVDQLLDVMPSIASELSQTTYGSNNDGRTRRERVILTDRDIENGIDAVGNALEFAADQVSESIQTAGKTTEKYMDKTFSADADDTSDYSRGKKEGKMAAHDEKWHQVWVGVPAGFGLISAINNGLFAGLITGWITKKIQENVEGTPQLSTSLREKIEDESMDFREGFRAGYISERSKIRSNRMDIGCWSGALVGALLF